MNLIQKVSLTALLSAASVASFANGSIPSCYNTQLPAPAVAPAVELFVVIDQTTLLDSTLKQSVANQVRPFLAAGNSFSVLVFSAYIQGKYTQLLANGQLDHSLPSAKRNDISKPLLSKFDQCMSRQAGLAAQSVGGALRSSFDGTSGDIAKSDILASLKDIASKVRQSPANEKVVLLVSDMLENSSLSSFYASQAVRKIDPSHELQLVEGNDAFGDFGGARFYVMGAGLLNNLDKKSKAQYRDPKTMQALTSFWRSYFEKSHAQLVEFGAPALLNQIK
jgi:hypothetical protein